ncbi:MAG TPA: hypothetical protein VNR86_11850 [Sphingomicrobium sp.]|nr:hypothetical protein [Sphingomicrobium sp.]
MTAAAFLPPPARPPHDPLWMKLGGTAAWTSGIAPKDVEVETGGCALRLSPAPGTERLLSEDNGSLGGLLPPKNVAIDCEGFIWLLGKTNGLLHRFDPCTCAFVTVPCTAGIGTGSREIVQPAALAAVDAMLFICDAGPPGRLLVFDRRSFALRSIWLPPAGSTPKPWSPRSVVVAGDTAYVADPANGAIHRFTRAGTWLGMWSGLGAVTALALDCSRRLYVIVPGAPTIARIEVSGKSSGMLRVPADVLGDFPPPPFPVAPNGTIDLGAICAGAAFDTDGSPAPFPAPPDPAFVTREAGPAIHSTAALPSACGTGSNATPRSRITSASAFRPTPPMSNCPPATWRSFPTAPGPMFPQRSLRRTHSSSRRPGGICG